MPVQVVERQRKSRVLTPSALPCLSQIATVNLTNGCAHGCVYCYAQTYSQYPGYEKVVVYTNTLEKMREELARKRERPCCVYFSPSTDLFQPIPEVLDLAYEILAFLFAHGAGAAFVTKGAIPAPHMALLCAHAELVRAQIGLITMNETIRELFEPRTAPVAARLAQLEQLAAAGIETDLRIDPILPCVTDDEWTLDALCSAAAEAGAKGVALNALYLKPALVPILRKHLEHTFDVDRILERYKEGVPLVGKGACPNEIALPVRERRAIYERARACAGRYGLAVRICGCKNPDITSETCNLSGTWPQPSARPQQMLLFET
jgi:DNA repair photolyase